MPKVNDNIYHPTASQSFITGIISAIGDVMATHPLWTIKTLSQAGLTSGQILAKARHNPLMVYHGVFMNASTMLPLTTIRITLSSIFEGQINKMEDPPVILMFGSSFVSGAISSMLGSPTELLRTMKLKQDVMLGAEIPKRMGFMQLASGYAKTYGSLALWKGAPSVATRDGLYTAAFFTGAPWLRQKLSPYFGDNIVNQMISYSLVSLTSSFLNHPFDTIKTVQHSLAAEHYLLGKSVEGNFVEACQHIIARNGWGGFFTGYPPRGLRFLIGLIIKASLIETMTNFWIKVNKESNSHESSK